MKFSIFVSMFLASTSFCAERWKNPEVWDLMQLSSSKFLDHHGWDDASISCASMIAGDGTVLDQTRYTVAASRKVIGYLSPTSYQKNVDVLKGLAFLYHVTTRHRDTSGHFTKKADQTKTESYLLSDQLYALRAILQGELAHPRHLKEELRAAFMHFDQAFWDKDHGGYAPALTSGAAVKEKEFASAVYALTALLIPLYEADLQIAAELRPMVGDRIKTLANIINRSFYDVKTGWIIEQFDETWQPQWRDDRRFGDQTIAIVGHNYQTAWVLMRCAELSLFDFATAQKFEALAQTILRSLHRKRVLSTGYAGNGYLRESNTPHLEWGSQTPWWQQAEAILALTHAEVANLIDNQAMLKQRDRAVDIYLDEIVDGKLGGTFAEVPPKADTRKGDVGKADYHDAELAIFMRAYHDTLQRYDLNHPYPNEAISGGSADDSTNLGRRRSIRANQLRMRVWK